MTPVFGRVTGGGLTFYHNVALLNDQSCITEEVQITVLTRKARVANTSRGGSLGITGQ